MSLTKGTRVGCEDCDGQHTGTVVAVLGPGWYGVAWDDRNANYGKPGNTEPQFPDHFLRQHKNHLAMVGDLAVNAI